MSRVVYIGGFGNGKDSAERVASALEEHFDDVDPFTFSQAIENPDTIRCAVEEVCVLTHSAGMLLLPGTWPERICAFNAPLPTPQAELLARTALKTIRMNTPGIYIKSRADAVAVSRYNLSAAAELISHPRANLRQLGNIARFNALEEAAKANEVGIPTSLTYTLHDEYYQLSETDIEQARQNEVRVVWLDGVHDELVLRPQATLTAYINSIRSLTNRE